MSFSYIRENELTQDEVKWLETEARDYCVSHGMVYKDSEGRLQHIPVTLLPSPFPQKQFTAAKEVHTLAADPFTSKLFDIYDKVWQQGNVQPISLGIFRSDYLIDKSDGLHRCSDYSGEVTPKPAKGSISIKQVEMNTISLGGITFSCFVPKMHRYLLQLIGQETSKVPLNNALDEAAGALVKAWELYGSERFSEVVFVLSLAVQVL
ncbi:Glutathione synthetase [Acropora cervicornis]|uniref:Glutathione synthetase n=1 Tax=Acropora cervicornis TaxID=6130 RepID=A0AAD9Q922_ACRCE|nr:Glutathione synthetase [Acropora cervicornis]